MLVYIRGAGDIASGIAARLYRARMQIVMSDLPVPTAVRRTVSFSEAIRLGETEMEGIRAVRARDAAEVRKILAEGNIAVLADPEGQEIPVLKPDILVDAILAKRNIGTTKDMARLVLGIGPGFTAGEDCHAVIETMRGHTMGRVLYSGQAIKNTGVPGNVGGYTVERVLRASGDGIFHPLKEIGSLAEEGETVAMVETASGNLPVLTVIAGMIRGMLQDGVPVHTGMKSGDVDPRGAGVDFHEASDKALAIGGGVLEAILHFTGE